MGSIAKAVKRVIPREIQPILPIAASMFGGPLVGSYLGGLASTAKAGSFLNALNNPIVSSALGSGITSAGVDLLTSGKIDPKTLATSTLFGAGGQYFKGLEKGDKFLGMELGEKAAQSFQDLGNLVAPTSVDKGKVELTGDIVKGGSTALTAGGSIAAYNAAEEAQREYDEMMAGREADAAADRQSRIDYITRYMNMAGFSQDEIDDALARSGYRTGGRVGLMGTRVGYKIGGSTMQNILARLFNVEVPAERLEEMRQNRADFLFNENVDAEDYPSQDYLNKVRNASEKQATKELEEYMKKIGMDPFNPPEGSMEDKMIDQIMEPRKEGRVKEDDENQTPGQEVLKQLKDFDVLPSMDDMGYMDETMQRLLNSRKGKAEGGIMNLKMGGMPAEMDLRGGGFVPIGAKEKADDVPARLSKNEFVMTADAVRAAGGGSVNKGAKRMYDLMNKLEARV